MGVFLWHNACASFFDVVNPALIQMKAERTKEIGNGNDSALPVAQESIYANGKVSTFTRLAFKTHKSNPGPTEKNRCTSTHRLQRTALWLGPTTTTLVLVPRLPTNREFPATKRHSLIEDTTNEKHSTHRFESEVGL